MTRGRGRAPSSVADDVADGKCCANCTGTYFARAHGYPVVCRFCRSSFSKAEMMELGYQNATAPEITAGR